MDRDISRALFRRLLSRTFNTINFILPPFLLRRNKVEWAQAAVIDHTAREFEILFCQGRRWLLSCWMCLDSVTKNLTEQKRVRSNVVGHGGHREFGECGVRAGVESRGDGGDWVQIPTIPLSSRYSPPVGGVRLAPVTAGCRQKDAVHRNRGARDTPRRDRRSSPIPSSPNPYTRSLLTSSLLGMSLMVQSPAK